VIAVFRATVRIVPQARARVVERSVAITERSRRSSLVVPFIDRLRPLIDLREQVVSFRRRPVITETTGRQHDSVIYFQVTDAKAASYEIQNYIQAIEQLTVTTLRNVIAHGAREDVTSRDETTTSCAACSTRRPGSGASRVNRVELKAIDPPASIKDTMENDARDARSRAAILRPRARSTARSLTAEGQKQAAVLRAQGVREATSRSEGTGEGDRHGSSRRSMPATQTPAARLIIRPGAPQIAPGASNKVWIIPAEFQRALGQIGRNEDKERLEESGAAATAPAQAPCKACSPRREPKRRTYAEVRGDASRDDACGLPA